MVIPGSFYITCISAIPHSCQTIQGLEVMVDENVV